MLWLSRGKRASWAAILVIGTLAGCGSGDPPQGPSGPPTFADISLKAGVLDESGASATLRILGGEWSASRKSNLDVLGQPLNMAQGSVADQADVLLFPGHRLGDLIDAGALAPLPESLTQAASPPSSGAGGGNAKSASLGSGSGLGSGPSSGFEDDPGAAFEFEQVLPAAKTAIPKYGPDRMALTYGGSVLTLAYRREAIAALAVLPEAKSLGLVPTALDSWRGPETWEQLDALIGLAHGRDWNGDGKPDSGIAMAFGPNDRERIATYLTLARAASLGRSRDQYSFEFDFQTMKPRLETPPFVEALTAIARWKAFGSEEMSRSDAEAARKAFREGRAAFLIDRAEKAAQWADPQTKKAIGAAALPGSLRVYDSLNQAWATAPELNRPSYLPNGGGWLVGVSSKVQGQAKAAAEDLARFLAGPESAGQIARDRVFPLVSVRANKRIAPPAPGLDIRLWGDAVQSSLSSPVVIPGLRIPDANAYLDDFERARIAVFQGAPAPSALADAAKTWSRRVEEAGLARQRWHYSRSLLEVPTDPLPPPAGPSPGRNGQSPS